MRDRLFSDPWNLFFFPSPLYSFRSGRVGSDFPCSAIIDRMSTDCPVHRHPFRCSYCQDPLGDTLSCRRTEPRPHPRKIWCHSLHAVARISAPANNWHLPFRTCEHVAFSDMYLLLFVYHQLATDVPHSTKPKVNRRGECLISNVLQRSGHQGISPRKNPFQANLFFFRPSG